MKQTFRYKRCKFGAVAKLREVSYVPKYGIKFVVLYFSMAVFLTQEKKQKQYKYISSSKKLHLSNLFLKSKK